MRAHLDKYLHGKRQCGRKYPREGGIHLVVLLCIGHHLRGTMQYSSDNVEKQSVGSLGTPDLLAPQPAHHRVYQEGRVTCLHPSFKVVQNQQDGVATQLQCGAGCPSVCLVVDAGLG